MLTVLRHACQTLMSTHNDFFVVGALPDYSFETCGSAKLRRFIDSMAQAGVCAPLVAQLRQGINGNLQAILERQNPALGPITANCKYGTVRPDLRFGPPGTALETLVEIKLVFDLTVLKYYPATAADGDKLMDFRRQGFQGQLFQVVYFMQLPRYEYPAGTWLKLDHYSARSQQAGYRGIATQYRKLRACMHQDPAWPDDPPAVVNLAPPDPATLACLGQWFSTAFQPDNGPWTFDPETHLDGAAVGCAIWQY